jgi:hypothetical protein
MKKLTNTDIIARLNKLYNNKYDLSKVNYTGQNNKLSLICPIHGAWSKMAQKILGHGNPKKFASNKINTRTPKQKTFGQLYEDTLAREQLLKNAGYNIVSIWESDYR